MPFQRAEWKPPVGEAPPTEEEAACLDAWNALAERVPHLAPAKTLDRVRLRGLRNALERLGGQAGWMAVLGQVEQSPLWRRHVCWAAAWPYVAGSLVALGAWSLVRYVPGKPAALLMLGTTAFLVRLLPVGLKPNPERLGQGLLYGSASQALLLTGVSGPLVDTFFLGGRLDRREIVATKAVCQVFGHGAKLAYFGGIVDQAAGVDPVLAALAVACSMLGTTLARRLLEAMTDAQFRLWANRLITAVALYYVAQGTYLLAQPWVLAATTTE